MANKRRIMQRTEATWLLGYRYVSIIRIVLYTARILQSTNKLMHLHSAHFALRGLFARFVGWKISMVITLNTYSSAGLITGITPSLLHHTL